MKYKEQYVKELSRMNQGEKVCMESRDRRRRPEGKSRLAKYEGRNKTKIEIGGEIKRIFQKSEQF